MKIRPVGVEMFHAEGQTDMTKLMVNFCNSANAPKKCRFIPSACSLDAQKRALPGSVQTFQCTLGIILIPNSE